LVCVVVGSRGNRRGRARRQPCDRQVADWWLHLSVCRRRPDLFMAIGGAAFPPQQHANALVRATWGGVWLTGLWIWWRGLRVAWLLLAAAAPATVMEWRRPLPWLDPVSVVMVVARKKKRRRLQLRCPTNLRTRGTSGRKWHAWRPSWYQAPDTRRRQCATLIMEAAGRLMSPVMVQQFLQFPISYHRQ
jgi:hypothetical protein